MQKTKLKILTEFIGDIPKNIENDLVTGVCTDSRNIESGCIFVAIKGENFDGHDFVGEVLAKGAVLAVVERLISGVSDERQLIVENTRDAMIKIGGNYRRLFNAKTIGITGSVGKTTTKEFVACALSMFGETLKTEGNKNNELGVPNTLFNLNVTQKFSVIEMGMDAQGDISKLTAAVKPDIAVITNVGVAHLESLKTRENILKAKLEICEGVADGGYLVYNIDNDMLSVAEFPTRLKTFSFGIDNEKADIYAKNIEFNEFSTSFDLISKAPYAIIEVEIPMLGRHNVYNALAAYAVAECLGLDGMIALKGLGNYESCGMRQDIIRLDDVTVIEDCYNANPDSMRAAIETLAAIPDATSRVAVLGDMLELGEISDEAHREIGRICAHYKIDAVIAYGERAKLIAEEAKKTIENTAYTDDRLIAADYLSDFCIDGSAVLFKASRGIRLEEVMDLFYRQKGQ